MEALAQRPRGVASETESLVEGHTLRCPRCGTRQELVSYFVFDRPEAHADELNVVMKCRAKVRNSRTGRVESCRCIFSVGDPIDLISEVAA